MSDDPPPLSPAARRLLIVIENRPGFLGIGTPPTDDDPPFTYGQPDDEDGQLLTAEDWRLLRATGATLADVEQVLALREWELRQLRRELIDSMTPTL